MPNLITSLLSDLFSSVGSLLTYLAVAYGLYHMAASIGFKNAWMAWIPFCQAYTRGAVADEYCKRNENRKTSYRKKLLALEIALTLLAGILIVAAIVVVTVLIFTGLEAGSYTPESLLNDLENGLPSLSEDVIMGVGLGALLFMVALLALLIPYLVFHYNALHKIYKLFAPESATVFLVLSIFVPLATPILFLILSKKPPQFTDDTPEVTTVGAENDTWDWNA